MTPKIPRVTIKTNVLINNNSGTNLLDIAQQVSLLLRTDKFTLFILYLFFYFLHLKRIHPFLCRLAFCFLILLSFFPDIAQILLCSFKLTLFLIAAFNFIHFFFSDIKYILSVCRIRGTYFFLKKTSKTKNCL